MHKHSGCCGCSAHTMGRRTFLAAVGGAAAGTTVLTSAALGQASEDAGATAPMPTIPRKELVVQPVLLYALHTRREAASWRPWGAIHTEGDVQGEAARIGREMENLKRVAEFPVAFRPVALVNNMEQAGALRAGDADVMLIYAANGGGGELATLISPDRYNLVVVRHKSGPVSLWYEIIHPRYLRRAVDEYTIEGLEVNDVVVDSMDEVLWRLRALYGLHNTVGSRIVAVGAPSGWDVGGQKAPQIAAEQWKLDMITVPYEELGKRIVAAQADPDRVRRAEARAREYLHLPETILRTDAGFVQRGFLLTSIFEDLLVEHQAPALTVNECMTTIMPLSRTTACLSLSTLNDDGWMAFCESDFVVIPSGILLHHISSKPVFLNDPTFPHDGLITLAHCTAPRRMDGQNLEKTTLLTHFESDYGVAPKVDMKLGEVVTVIDPDFNNKRWVGFKGRILENPFLDICRSQIDVSIDGDEQRLKEHMAGFHWMMCYGDYTKEVGYALHKRRIDWDNVSDTSSARA